MKTLSDYLKKVPFLATCFIFLGSIAALSSALFLSGWRGAAGSRDSLKLLMLLSCVIFVIIKKFPRVLGPRNEFVFLYPILFGLSISVFQSKPNFSLGVISYLAISGFGFFTLLLTTKSLKVSFLLSLPLGQLLLVVFLHIASSAGNLNFGAQLFILVGLSLSLISVLYLRMNRSITPLNWQIPQFDAVYNSVLTILLLIYAISATTPVLGYDALSMKLWLPFQWEHSNSIGLFSNHIHSGITGGFSYSAFLGMPFGETETGSTLQLLSLIHFLYALFSVGSSWFSSNNFQAVKLWSSTLFALPFLLWQMSNSYDDIWAMSIVGLITLFVYEIQNKLSLYVSALSAASLLITKLTLLPITFSIITVTVFKIFKHESRFRRKMLLTVTFLGSFFTFVSVPFLWKWFNYQNPVWPLYNSIFKASTLPFSDEKFNMPFASADFLKIIFSPVTTIIDPGSWTEEIAPGVYGATAAIVFLAILLPLNHSKSANVFSKISLLTFAFAWIIELQYLRYMVYVLPIAVIAFLENEVKSNARIQIAAERASSRLLVNFLLISGIFGIIIGNPVSPDRVPFKVALGIESEESYRLRSMPVYHSIKWINNDSVGYNVVLGANVFQRLWFKPDIDILQLWEYKNDSLPNYLIVDQYEDLFSASKIDKDCYLLSYEKEGWSVFKQNVTLPSCTQ